MLPPLVTHSYTTTNNSSLLFSLHSTACNKFTTNGGVTTTISQTTVATAIDADSVKAGTPYFVRVAAINEAGLGAYDLAIPR